VLTVFKFLSVTLLCTICWFDVKAQDLKVSGSQLSLPEGNVLGAAFDESAGKLIVQQDVLTTENQGLVIRAHRELSSWDLKTGSVITTQALDDNQGERSAYPCGRVETSAKLRRALICSAGSYLELIDTDNLHIVGKIAQQSAEYIRDFAVDDLRSRLFVLTSAEGDSVRLTGYSLLNGSKEHETVLPVAKANGISLAIAPQSGQIGIAVNVTSHSGSKSNIFSCVDDTSFTCTTIAQIEPVSQISFLGRRILIALSTFADNKKDCLLAVDPASRSVTREYCSEPTGVHYALGVVKNRYVVAFTGISRRKWLSEENLSVTSSFSVWRLENSRVAAVAQRSTNYGSFQNELRVAASATESLFVAYQRVSNVLWLYSIEDGK